jgi:hypothetical protein
MLKKNRKKMLKYVSVVKETMLSISEQKSDLKRLELTVKEQRSMMTQFFTNTKGQIEVYMHKNQRCIYFFKCICTRCFFIKLVFLLKLLSKKMMKYRV